MIFGCWVIQVPGNFENPKKYLNSHFFFQYSLNYSSIISTENETEKEFGKDPGQQLRKNLGRVRFKAYQDGHGIRYYGY